MTRIIAVVRTRLLRLTRVGWLTAVAEVTFTAVAHPRRRPWDDRDRSGPDIPGPRRPAD